MVTLTLTQWSVIMLLIPVTHSFVLLFEFTLLSTLALFTDNEFGILSNPYYMLYGLMCQLKHLCIRIYNFPWLPLCLLEYINYSNNLEQLKDFPRYYLKLKCFVKYFYYLPHFTIVINFMEYSVCVYKPRKHLLYFNINNTNSINRYIIILHFYFHYFQTFFNNNIESTIKLLTYNGDRIFSFTLFHMIPCISCFLSEVNSYSQTRYLTRLLYQPTYLICTCIFQYMDNDYEHFSGCKPLLLCFSSIVHVLTMLFSQCFKVIFIQLMWLYHTKYLNIPILHLIINNK